MPPGTGERGQATVEFVALLPLLVLVGFAAWQAAVAGQAIWLAGSAARAAFGPCDPAFGLALFLLAAVPSALLACAVGALAPFARADNPPAPVAIGTTVEDFTLPDADGAAHSLASLKGKNGTVLIFIATRCPVSNGYNERMEKLAQDYKAKGINVVGINANETEPASEVKAHAAEKHLTFTILKDAGSKIADRFGAQRTPEVFFLDASNKLVYHGRIDNAQNPANVTANDLHDAIEAVLAGKPVAKTESKAFGCSIKRAGS
jgi:peroxiredoxin